MVSEPQISWLMVVIEQEEEEQPDIEWCQEMDLEVRKWKEYPHFNKQTVGKFPLSYLILSTNQYSPYPAQLPGQHQECTFMSDLVIGLLGNFLTFFLIWFDLIREYLSPHLYLL